MIDRRIFVYGSESIALDVLRAAGEGFVSSRLISRQSVISGMSRPISTSLSKAPDASTVRAEADAASSLMMWARLERNHVDGVIWDLSDERFGVERLSNDAYRTLTPDYSGVVLSEGSGERKTFSFGSDEHFNLFRFAAARFVALLNAVGLGSRTLVLAPEYASNFNGEVSAEHAAAAAEMNSSWRRYWKYLHDVCQLPVALVPECRTVGDVQHRWGPAPFHFTSATLEELARSVRNFFGTVQSRGPARSVPLSRPVVDDRPPVSLDAFTAAGVADGVHRIVVGDSELDVLVARDGGQPVDRIPVFFSGALSPGQEVKGPVFSGREISRELDLPFISISDPCFELAPGISLGWYAGSEWSDTQESIAQVLMAISEYSDKPLLLIGGSGGGFAALELMIRMKSPDGFAAVVWNPQLDLSQYGPESVAQFLATCFPSVYCEFGPDSLASALSAVEQRFRVRSKLAHGAASGKLKNSLILQQATDWHLDSHLRPFAEAFGVDVPDRGEWSNINGICGVVGEWGDGHVPPPRELLQRIIGDAATRRAPLASRMSIFANCPG